MQLLPKQHNKHCPQDAGAEGRIHIVFNNVPYGKGLQCSWGFSCLIEGLNKTILFDTGGNGEIDVV